MSARRIQQPPQSVINPCGDYVDDNSIKEVFLQADGVRRPDPEMDRHVCIRWTNAVIVEDGLSQHITQIVHLTGGIGGYAFYTPQIKLQSQSSRLYNTFYSLGRFNRAQRDRIIELGRGIRFHKNSSVNGCRAWMRDLLQAMLNEGMIQQALFDFLDANIPLKRRVPEVSGSQS